MDRSRVRPGSTAPTSLDHPAVVLEDGTRIPAAAHSLEDFRGWAHSDRFPREGRIDYLAGDVEVEMGPEDLFTHGAVKSAIAAELHRLIAETDRGYLFVDRAGHTAPAAGLSVEPDVVALLHDTAAAGRARLVPARSGKPGRFVEIPAPTAGPPARSSAAACGSSGARHRWGRGDTAGACALPRYSFIGPTPSMPPEGSAAGRFSRWQARLVRHAVRDRGPSG